MNRGGWQQVNEDEAFEGLHEEVPPGAYCATALGVLGALLLLGNALGRHFQIAWNMPMIPWVGALCYATYLMEACRSNSWRYMSNIRSEDELEEYIKGLQNAEPRIRFHIQNFRYERRGRQDQGSMFGNGLQDERVERVDTHYAVMDYPIRGHTDMTLSLSEILAAQGDASGIELTVEEARRRVLLLLCEFKLSFHPRDKETEANLKDAKWSFYRDNTIITDQQERWEDQTVVCKDVKKYLLATLTTKGTDRHTRPWWMRRWLYLLCTFLLLSVFFRTMLFNATWKVVWQTTKHFSMMEPSAWTEEPVHAKQPGAQQLEAVSEGSEGFVAEPSEEPETVAATTIGAAADEEEF